MAKQPLYPHVPKRHLEQTEMIIYDDGTYRVSLKANGMYTMEEYEPTNKQWYAKATGPHKYMVEVARDSELSRLLTIL